MTVVWLFCVMQFIYFKINKVNATNEEEATIQQYEGMLDIDNMEKVNYDAMGLNFDFCL